MDRPTLEVADIFRRHGNAFRHAAGPSLAIAQRRAMTAIGTCRTAALGGHVEQCDACDHQRIACNSCANRHCPTCQSLARAAWIEHRTAELLDCEYFHVVFTIPEPIAAIALQNKAQVYGLLFRATAETLRTIAADPQQLGAEVGFFAVLHTWDQTLVHHPHLHCVVPGGGLSRDGTRWIACRPGFFLPVRVLSRLFRRLFLDALQEAFDTGQLHVAASLHALTDPARFAAHLQPTRHTDWVVYAKRPFAGPQQVVDYVGRYTHRVAIANHRLPDMEGDQVRFTYKDYRADPAQAQKTMTLPAGEFIRRFLLHVLPTGFHRIRYYGFLGAPSPSQAGPLSAAPRPHLADHATRRRAAPDRLSRPHPGAHRPLPAGLPRVSSRADARDRAPRPHLRGRADSRHLMTAMSRSPRAVDTLTVTAAQESCASLAFTPPVPTSSAAVDVGRSPFTRTHAHPRAPVRITPAPPLTASTHAHPIQSP